MIFSPPALRSYPLRLEVLKEGSRFIGDLIWTGGEKWLGWQSFKTLKRLKSNARCTFDGPIVRV